MAAPEMPAHVKPYANDLMHQWTKKIWSPALDNLTGVMDKTLWPEVHQKTASSWFSVGYFVPVPGTEDTKVREPISAKLIGAHKPEESTERQSHLQRRKKPPML